MRLPCKAGCGKTFASRGGEYAHRQRHHPEIIGRGHERRFSFVLWEDMEYALRLIAEGHRCASSPAYPWSKSRRPARS